MKNVYIFGAIILGLFVLMFVFSNLSNESYSFPSEAPNPSEILEDDQTKGNPQASVVLVEYSDFECPACRSYYPVISQLMDIYEDDILFVYRHFPLTATHRNAHLAARASEAAGNQDRFWDMHDLMFEGQNQWRARNAEPIFMGYAEELGLNLEQFQQDIDSEGVIEKVQRDHLSGIEAGVPGTPTFFINGERIANPQNLDEFISVIESFLSQDE